MELVKATPRAVSTVKRELTMADAQLAAQATLAHRRIENGYRLAETVVMRATTLSHLVTAVSHDNPALELALRGLEELTVLSASSVIRSYMGQ